MPPTSATSARDTARALTDAGAGAGAGAGAAIVLVGERLASVPGGLSAVLRLAESTGARVAWGAAPRR
jgi:NADH-quinone oxidoreductase subunit G